MPPIYTLKEPYEITPKELKHFNGHPWAASILRTSLQDGNGDYYPIVTWSRVPKLETGEDGFFAQTLDSPETIPFWLTLRRKNIGAVNAQLPKTPPTITVTSKSKSSDGSSKSYTTPAPPSRPPDTITLISLGNPGVSGHPSTAHGGVVASLFDEVMSLVAALHMPEVSLPDDVPPIPLSRDGKKYYTAQLDVRYKRPMGASNLVVFKAWTVAQDGRKFWTFAQAVQEEVGDGKGVLALEHPKRKTVRAEGSALWVAVDKLKTKL